MGSWFCLHCEDSVLLLHLATGLHCPAPALESGCGDLVTDLDSVSRVWRPGVESVCGCMSGIWGFFRYGFVSWVGMWGPCAALAPGSDVQNLVSRVLSASGVMCLAFRVHGLAWVMGTVLGLGLGSGVQLLLLGLLWGTGSGLQGLCSVLSLSMASGMCAVTVIGSNSMAAGVPGLGCGEEGNVIIASSSILVQNSCECSMATRRLSSVPGES